MTCLWDAVDAQYESDIEKELALLNRRWGKSMEVLGVQYQADVGSAACFKLSMPPSDPDFPVCASKILYTMHWHSLNGIAVYQGPHTRTCMHASPSV